MHGVEFLNSKAMRIEKLKIHRKPEMHKFHIRNSDHNQIANPYIYDPEIYHLTLLVYCAVFALKLPFTIILSD